MVLLLSSSLFLVSALLLLLLSLTPKLFKNGSNHRPPGPPGWPIIGNIFDLGPIPHRAMYKLRPKYGPLLWLKFFSVNTLVVQSAAAAAELFKNHDLAFCDHWCPHALTARDYNLGSLVLGRYGPYWRKLRRICSAELFVGRKINDTVSVRRKCVDDMIQNIEEASAAAVARGESGEVDLPHFLFLFSFNLVGNLVFSRDLLDSNSDSGREFYEAMSKVAELAGKPNVADFVPWLKWLDPQGMKRELTREIGRAMNIVLGFIEEKVEEQRMGTKSPNQDFLEALLEYRRREADTDSEPFSEKNMSILVLEMFFAGSETTSNSLEWILTELFRSPETVREVKEELNRVIGPGKKIDENDIDKLPYLQAVVKESLRLHPVAPLLVPRNTLEDTYYMGYTIPKNTQVLVNAWAIGRDPNVWKDPSSFKPERFLGPYSDIDYKGQNYELIPFGSGRRICIGMPLAHRVLHLVVASLLHCFDWRLGDSLTPDTVDMNEKLGMTTRKLVPLRAIPTKRIV